MTTATSIANSSAPLSTVAAAVIAVSGLLLIFLCTLVLAITLVKMAQQKKKRTSAETPTAILSMKLQENEADTPTYQNIDKSYTSNINTESNLAYETVKEQENEAGIHTYESIDESHASNINAESNLAYGTAK